MQRGVCERCQRVFDREDISRVTQRLGGSPTTQRTVQLCTRCIHDYERKQFVHEEGNEIIVSRAFVCRVCGTDISASVNRARVLCGRCETRLRQAEIRVMRINRNSYARPSMDF